VQKEARRAAARSCRPRPVGRNGNRTCSGRGLRRNFYLHRDRARRVAAQRAVGIVNDFVVGRASISACLFVFFFFFFFCFLFCFFLPACRYPCCPCSPAWCGEFLGQASAALMLGLGISCRPWPIPCRDHGGPRRETDPPTPPPPPPPPPKQKEDAGGSTPPQRPSTGAPSNKKKKKRKRKRKKK